MKKSTCSTLVGASMRMNWNSKEPAFVGCFTIPILTKSEVLDNE